MAYTDLLRELKPHFPRGTLTCIDDSEWITEWEYIEKDPYLSLLVDKDWIRVFHLYVIDGEAEEVEIEDLLVDTDFQRKIADNYAIIGTSSITVHTNIFMYIASFYQLNTNGGFYYLEYVKDGFRDIYVYKGEHYNSLSELLVLKKILPKIAEEDSTTYKLRMDTHSDLNGYIIAPYTDLGFTQTDII